MTIDELQETAETLSTFAAALGRYGAYDRARLYARKADAYWRRWIEAKEREHPANA